VTNFDIIFGEEKKSPKFQYHKIEKKTKKKKKKKKKQILVLKIIFILFLGIKKKPKI
jgi:hypothetical protein